MAEAVRIKEEPKWEEGVSENALETPEFNYDPIQIKLEIVKNEPVGINQPINDSANWPAGSAAGLYADNESSGMYHETKQYAGCVVKDELILEPVSLEESHVLPQPFSEGPNLSSACAPDVSTVNPKRAVPDKHTFVCDNCAKTFTQKRYLVQHMKVHKSKSEMPPKKRNHTCNLCEKKFIQLGHLRVHLRAHTGAKPYSCNICQKPFASLHTLTRHERSHSGEIIKPYTCEICNIKFASSSSLKLHRLIKHTKDKLYACEICKKKFWTKGNVTRHMSVHSGAKPYACELCQKRFKDPSHVKKHKLTHTGIKSHCCDICMKQFSTPGDLNRHKRIHDGLRPYSCEVCKKSFTESGTLKRHRTKFCKGKTHTKITQILAGGEA